MFFSAKVAKPVWNFCLRGICFFLFFSFLFIPAKADKVEKAIHGTVRIDFHIIAFFINNKEEPAHINWVHEANKWFPKMGLLHHFSYDSTSNWNNLNPEFLSHYQVVLFLDSRPDGKAQREAFQKYMEHGGGWMGFHFAGFALTPSEFPQNWDWYHNTFLGSGSYKSNTWKPVPATLRVENTHNPATRHLPHLFKSAANEWYRWENDLRKNPDIDILMAIDSSSFPLGTGPKPDEIWHNGYYPVVWSNKKYKMIYVNMGHNDLDASLSGGASSSFSSEEENAFLMDALKWLGSRKRTEPNCE